MLQCETDGKVDQKPLELGLQVEMTMLRVDGGHGGSTPSSRYRSDDNLFKRNESISRSRTATSERISRDFARLDGYSRMR